MSWYVYVARCADGSLYCGIARDVAARIAQHDAGKGARYTRGRGPLAVVLVQMCRSKQVALRIEYAIKQLPRPAKERLVVTPRVLVAIARRARAQAARARAAAYLPNSGDDKYGLRPVRTAKK